MGSREAGGRRGCGAGMVINDMAGSDHQRRANKVI